MPDLQLTPEMIEAINRVAEKYQNSPENVLRRAIFSYAAKQERMSRETDTTNVVPLRKAEE